MHATLWDTKCFSGRVMHAVTRHACTLRQSIAEMKQRPHWKDQKSLLTGIVRPDLMQLSMHAVQLVRSLDQRPT